MVSLPFGDVILSQRRKEERRKEGIGDWPEVGRVDGVGSVAAERVLDERKAVATPPRLSRVQAAVALSRATVHVAVKYLW
jgi:hypothetical protein